MGGGWEFRERGKQTFLVDSNCNSGHKPLEIFEGFHAIRIVNHSKIQVDLLKQKSAWCSREEYISKKNDLAETSHDIEWSIVEIVWLWDTHSKDRKVQNHQKPSMSNKGIVQMIK